METDALIVKVASEITLLSTLSIFITQLLDKKGQAGALMMNGLKCLLSSRCFVFIHLKYFAVLLSHDPFHTNSTILLCIVLLCTVYCITVLLYITVINQHHKYWSYWIFILYFAGTLGFLRFSVCGGLWGGYCCNKGSSEQEERRKIEVMVWQWRVHPSYSATIDSKINTCAGCVVISDWCGSSSFLQAGCYFTSLLERWIAAFIESQDDKPRH